MSLQPDRLIYPGISGTNPIVVGAYSQWSGIAKDAYKEAQKLAGQLANIPIPKVPLNAKFETQVPIANLTLPTAPQAPSLAPFKEPALPDLPPAITIPSLPDLTYVSLLLDTTEDVLRTALQGGAALPAATARQLRDRAYSEVFAEEQRAVSQAYKEYASRGFSEPSGVLNDRVSQVRTVAMGQRQKASREVYIQEQTAAIENLRAAINSSLQLENTNIQVYRTRAELEVEQVHVATEQSKLAFDEWRAGVERYDTQLKTQMAKLEYAGHMFDDQVKSYMASVQAAEAESRTDERRFQLNLAQDRAATDVQLKQADQAIEQVKYITSVTLEIKKALAAVSSQLASAAMSAVNIGASMNLSASESLQYGLDISYSGSMETGF